MRITAVQFASWIVDVRVLRVLRYRGQVLPRYVQMAVAAGVSLPLLCWTGAVAFQAWCCDLLPMQRVPAIRPV